MNTDNKTNKAPTNKLLETKDLLFVWKLIIKNLVFIIIIPVISYITGFIYTYNLNDIYGARCELLLKSNETYDYQDPIYQGLGAYGMYMDVQNQIRILNSRDLIEEVIDKINIQTSYFVTGRIKKVEVFETLPFKSEVNVLNDLIYELPIAVEILDQNKYELSYTLSGEEHKAIGLFNQELVTPNFLLNLKSQYEFNEDNLESIRSSSYEIVFHSKNYLVNKYKSSLSIENIEYTSVLSLTLEDELAQRAIFYLDTLAHTYVGYSKRVQLEVNQNTLENIQKQIDTVSVLIQEKESELLFYKDENSILSIPREEDNFFTQYIFYSKQKREIANKRASIRSLIEYFDPTNSSRVLPPSFYIEKEDLFLREAIEEIRSKQIDYELKKTQISEDNRSMLNRKKQIRMLKNDVQSYLENLLLAFDEEEKVVDKFIRDYKNDIKKIPKSEQDILNIQRELDVNNKMYLFLLEKKTNTLIARAGIIPQVRIIEKTVSLGRLMPDRGRIKAMFLLGGVILAFFIAIIRSLFFVRISNVSELAEIPGVNIVGGISFIKKIQNEIMVEADPKSNITESFRTIRTNLSYIRNLNDKEDNIARKIMISSFFPGEGKTFCSTNLSCLISKGDKRVLVIDFDLHRPKVHKTFQMKNDIGVSNFIIGKSNFDEVIKKDVYDNLDIILAGPVAPNPSELILRDKVTELFKIAEEKYDYIIVDTPPFGLLNDTFELAKYMDVFMVIMNTKYARRKGVENINEMLSKFDDLGKGIVLNGIKETRLQHYYSKYAYKYSYSYNYSYGYGNNYSSNYDSYDNSDS